MRKLLKPEITRFTFEFHANGIFPKGSNASFITLVPKVHDPQNLNDFRPISLIGCVYKIVAKLLSNRLKRVMPDIWKLKIPSKSLVFAWRLIRDRLPTRMNHRRRQVVINEVQCPLCGDVEEEAAHLFFSCKKILPIWWESLSWVGVAIVLPQNPRDHYLGKQLTRWRSWWIGMTWTTWKHKNRIIFQNDMFDGSKLLDDALLVLWTWIRNMERDFVTHFNQWSSNLKEVFSK
ncbi:Transposon TX1 uncharacterized protein [Glycine soja]